MIGMFYRNAQYRASLGSEGLFRFEAIRLCVYIRPNKSELSQLFTNECAVRPEAEESSLVRVLGWAEGPPGPDMGSVSILRVAGLDWKRLDVGHGNMDGANERGGPGLP